MERRLLEVRGLLGPSGEGLLVGAPRFSLSASQSGVAYLFAADALSELFSIQTTLVATPTAAAVFQGSSQSSLNNRQLGNSVRYGADLNSDGSTDALIAAPNYTGVGAASGAVFVEF